MEFIHKTVLLNETIECLNIKPNGVYVDGTAGGGGLSSEILSRLSSDGCLICIDQDPDAIAVCKKRFSEFNNAVIIEDNFVNIVKIVHNLGFEYVDGVGLDLGVSSYQLDAAERGFSFHKDAPLDMRMSKSGNSAYNVVNFLDQDELKKVIFEYGEERFARGIADKIVKSRSKKLIESTTELAEIIKEAIPNAMRREGGHPARRTFQAIRVYVNSEIENLKVVLDRSFEVLKNSGRLAVITFHSLEDRMVKNKISQWSAGCLCPSDFPVCVCGNSPKVKAVSKKGIRPSKIEVETNPRSRSARLRVCEKNHKYLLKGQ